MDPELVLRCLAPWGFHLTVKSMVSIPRHRQKEIRYSGQHPTRLCIHGGAVCQGHTVEGGVEQTQFRDGTLKVQGGTRGNEPQFRNGGGLDQ